MRVSRNFDDLAHLYDRTRGGERRGRNIATDLSQRLRRDRLAFEVGVGTGVVALGLRELGYAVAGCDISRNMLGHAYGRLGPRVLQADAQSLPVASASLEQAYCCWVMHLVADPVAVLGEVARALRPGGRFVVVGNPVDPGVTDPIRELVAPLYEEAKRLRPERERPDGAGALRRLSAGTGLTVADTGLTSPATFEQSPAEAARELEERAFSWMDGIGDGDWKRLIEPVVAELRALPSADRPVVRQAFSHEIVVLERE